MKRILFVTTCLLSFCALSVREEDSVVVRPGREGRPYWNGYAIMFFYPPKFDFKLEKGAVKYRYVILDDIEDKLSSEAPYLAFYCAEKNPTGLAKARALGDNMTRMTDDDGLESTCWSEDQIRQDVWPNCMFASAFALEELAG